MDTNEPGRTGSQHDQQKGGIDAPSTPASSQPSGNLGDTQPFRPATHYRPLTSEPPLEESSLQQTAPYRPIQQVSVAPKKGSSTAFILGLLALLLVAAAVAAYFIIRGSSGAGGGSMPVERALPANALGYFSINPAPAESQRKAFEKLREAFESQPGFEAALSNLLTQVQRDIADTGLPLGSTTDLATLDALASYLGGSATIAVLAPSQGDLISLKPSSSGGISPLAAYDVVGRNVVALIDLDFTTDGSKQGIIADLRAVKDNLDKAKVVESYHGTDIRQYVAGPLQIYFALLGGTSTAAVGINSVPIKVLIDELRADKGLKEDEAFKYLSGKVPTERVATLYLNLGEIIRSIKVLIPDADTTYNGKQIKLDGRVLMSLSAQDDGAQIDVATQGFAPNWANQLLAPAQFTYDARINPNARPDSSTLNDVPADSIAFVVGSDPGSVLLSILDALQNYDPQRASFVEPSISDVTGLDARNDILPWMSGDYIISVPTYDMTTISLPPPAIGQVKLSEADRAKAADVIKRGVQEASQGRTRIFDIKGWQFFTTSSDKSSETIIGAAKDRAIMSYDRDGDVAKVRIESVLSGLGKGFGTTDKWKVGAPHLPEDSNLIGYLDAATLREIAEGTMTPQRKADYDERTAPFLKPIKYVLIGSATDTASNSEMSRNLTRIFLGIGK